MKKSIGKPTLFIDNNTIFNPTMSKKIIYITEGQEERLVKLIIKENSSVSTLMCCDIQPEYQDYLTFEPYEFGEYVNSVGNSARVVFLYNGSDTLGMITQNEYYYWLLETCEIDEDILNRAVFFDKGYAFFRFAMDETQMSREEVVELIRYMIENNINDSQDIDFSEVYDEDNTILSIAKEYFEDAYDSIYITDIIDFLSNYNNITLIGGGRDECLEEVELALLALNKNYTLNNNFVY